MYFCHLPAFDPRTGINTDKFNKHPFISSIDGLFEPNQDPFNPQRAFPFHRIEIDKDRFFFLSEPNLLKVFKNPFLGENPILIENRNPIKKEYTNKLLEEFYSGYTKGLVGFKDELGITFSRLTLSQQNEVVEINEIKELVKSVFPAKSYNLYVKTLEHKHSTMGRFEDPERDVIEYLIIASFKVSKAGGKKRTMPVCIPLAL